MNLDARFEEIERRLERLERLVFMGFQDTREVAEYAYETALQDPGDIQRLTWKQSSFHLLTDKDATNVGLAFHELVLLKRTMRTLRKQTRLDALAIIRDMVRRARKEHKLGEAA